MTVQVLVIPGCGHGRQAVDMVRSVLDALASDALLETITVATTAEAREREFPGSPTVRINGVDIVGEAPPADFGLG